jgi:acyl-coenzyme A thioesterase PaaI-like protein
MTQEERKVVDESRSRATSESFRTWSFRRLLNVWPCYWGTGGKVTFIASDWREVNVRLTLGWRTRNYVGTIFGGSLYGAVDPIYMLMLIKILGPEYTVWDKAATVRFKKPGRGVLQARFQITDAELADIRLLTAATKSIDRVYPVEFRDADGQLIATIEKTIYIRRT